MQVKHPERLKRQDQKLQKRLKLPNVSHNLQKYQEHQKRPGRKSKLLSVPHKRQKLPEKLPGHRAKRQKLPEHPKHPGHRKLQKRPEHRKLHKRRPQHREKDQYGLASLTSQMQPNQNKRPKQLQKQHQEHQKRHQPMPMQKQ